MQLYHLKILNAPSQNIFRLERNTYTFLIRMYYKDIYKGNNSGIFNSFIQTSIVGLYSALKIQR